MVNSNNDVSPRRVNHMLRKSLEWVNHNRKKSVGIVFAGAVVMLLVGYAYWTTFAPIQVNEQLSPGAQLVKGGDCQDGDPGHTCTGNVSIVEENGSYSLYFKDYDATDGPDVWFYLTVNPNEGDTNAVEDDGLRVLVPQTDNGMAEIEGTFSIPLRTDFNATAWGGLSVWCADYNILMGSVGFST
jgi:hypothetical protein